MYIDQSHEPAIHYKQPRGPSGVFIPIEDWELIKKELDLKLEIPEWHKEILADRQNKYQTGNLGLKDADSVLKEIETGL